MFYICTITFFKLVNALNGIQNARKRCVGGSCNMAVSSLHLGDVTIKDKKTKTSTRYRSTTQTQISRCTSAEFTTSTS